MFVMIFTMLIVLLLAAGVIAVVVMGMEGTGRSQHPDLANAMARTARHLNGEGEPPRALVAVFGEMDEVGDLNVRELSGRIKTLGSAATAASARSARSAWTALSARSAASANPPTEETVEAADSSTDDLGESDASAAHEGFEVPAVTAGDEATDHDEAPDHDEVTDHDVEVPDVDDEVVDAMSAALEADADEVSGADPYGVLGLPEADLVAPHPEGERTH